MSMITDIAVALDRAERERTPMPPLSETYPLLAPTEAYAIQSALLDIKRAQGTRVVGRKIGLTSQAMQQQMGVNQPDYGFLLDTMVVPPGGVLACSEFLQARIEPEVAFWLAEDVVRQWQGRKIGFWMWHLSWHETARRILPFIMKRWKQP